MIHSVGHQVKIHKVTPASDYEHGDVEIKVYVVFPHGGVNRLPHRPLILDVTLTDTIWTVFRQGFCACMPTQCRLWVYNSGYQQKKHDTQFPPMTFLNLTTFWKMRSGRKYWHVWYRSYAPDWSCSELGFVRRPVSVWSPLVKCSLPDPTSFCTQLKKVCPHEKRKNSEIRKRFFLAEYYFEKLIQKTTFDLSSQKYRTPSCVSTWPQHRWWSYCFTHTLTPPTHKTRVSYSRPSPQVSPSPPPPSVCETSPSYSLSPLSLTTPTPFHIFPTCSRFIPYNKQPHHPYMKQPPLPYPKHRI